MIILMHSYNTCNICEISQINHKINVHYKCSEQMILLCRPFTYKYHFEGSFSADCPYISFLNLIFYSLCVLILASIYVHIQQKHIHAHAHNTRTHTHTHTHTHTYEHTHTYTHTHSCTHSRTHTNTHTHTHTHTQ